MAVAAAGSATGPFAAADPMTASAARPEAVNEPARPRGDAGGGLARVAQGSPSDAPPRLGTPAAPVDVERWLAELAIEPVDRGVREAVHSWDVVLDGRRRRGLRVTLILAAEVGLVVWAHYAPPLNDSFRKSYRLLLRWNDEQPFAKFALGEDERIVLIAELPPTAVDRDALGEALARLLAIADDRLDESAGWLWPGGRRPAKDAAPVPWPLLDRYAPVPPREDAP